jgi:hypothetical protein
MVEMAEIFRLHGEGYRGKFGHRMPPSHLRAMKDIEHCRTPALGGQLYYCSKCDEQRYSYHSCKNRHCPKCQNDQANEWLEEQKNLLLPVTHFLVTFTLPEELRAIARSNQKPINSILFRASSEALQKLALDPRFVGGRLGMVGVLHTWTRSLLYHPHVHYIVAGGGLSRDGKWVSSREDFLVPVKALSPIFRAKFRDELKKTQLLDQVNAEAWKKNWVVHSEQVGTGEAAFKYLAPYVFRVAISNRSLLKLEDGRVTFKYKDSATDQIRLHTVPAEEFIRRFLQHVLPSRFVKVRYYGLMSPGNRELLAKARELLGAPVPNTNSTDREAPKTTEPDLNIKERPAAPCCPNCGSVLTLIRELKRMSGLPP